MGERVVFKAHESPQCTVLRPRSHAAFVSTAIARRCRIFHNVVFTPCESLVAQTANAHAAECSGGTYGSASREKRAPRKSTIWHKSIPLLRCRLSFMHRNLPLQAAQPPCTCNAALEATQAHYPHDAKTRACPFKGKYLQYPLGGYAFVLGFCKNIRQRHPRYQRRPTRAS